MHVKVMKFHKILIIFLLICGSNVYAQQDTIVVTIKELKEK